MEHEPSRCLPRAFTAHTVLGLGLQAYNIVMVDTFITQAILYAYKPPTQESNQAANNGDDCYRYARDGPAAETALVDQRIRGIGGLLDDVAGDGAGAT